MGSPYASATSVAAEMVETSTLTAATGSLVGNPNTAAKSPGCSATIVFRVASNGCGIGFTRNETVVTGIRTDLLVAGVESSE